MIKDSSKTSTQKAPPSKGVPPSQGVATECSAVIETRDSRNTVANSTCSDWSSDGDVKLSGSNQNNSGEKHYNNISHSKGAIEPQGFNLKDTNSEKNMNDTVENSLKKISYKSPPQHKTPSQSLEKSKNPQNSRRSASCVISCLRGLYITGKLMCNDNWTEIEIKNLELLSKESNARNEFYIIKTNLIDIRNSLRTSRLLVTDKTIENLATVSRNKKYLFLKTRLPKQNDYSIVGIVSVDRVDEISVNNEGQGYFVSVTYFCLSNPWIKRSDLFESNYTDGTEIFYNVAHHFVQQYLMAHRHDDVDVLLQDVYVSSNYFKAFVGYMLR